MTLRARSLAAVDAPVLPALVVGAWLLLVVGQATGNAALVHQHEGAPPTGAPTLIAVIAFLLGWQVMIAATMLPASLPSIRAVATTLRGTARPGPTLTAFLAAFVGVWTAFGLLAYIGNAAVQRAAVAWPWLGARPWLVEATIIALAAAYQFTPLKQRSLAACRHPAPSFGDRSVGPQAARLGLAHGLACIGSAWALMLVMIVPGMGDLWWMAALMVVMVYEAIGQHGERAASAVGLLLLWLAALIVLPGWLPA